MAQKAAIQIKVNDVIRMTYQSGVNFPTDNLRVLETGTNPHGHLYFVMLTGTGEEMRQDFFKTDLLEVVE
jgi:hypothetical protein